ncbi:PIN domain-containing protein [Candidatus Gottesmanbacteria bacterium]|nr:PIN domain-containing protein [Candidatus Gottesmanbacteria bacterium]
MDIFFDSNYYIGLVNKLDSTYLQSIILSNRLKKEPYKPIISNLVFLEVVTVISQRVGRKTSIKTGESLKNNAGIIKIYDELEEKTWDIFKKIQQKDVSFVDCSTLVLLKEKKIEKLVTFDTHFKKFSKQFRFSVIS